MRCKIQENRLNVLLCAYACEPGRGSEPGVGWKWSEQISQFANVHVITRKNNKHVIQNELMKNPNPNIHFHYVDLPKWLRFWKKGQKGVHLYCYLWQIWTYFFIKNNLSSIKFDIGHHITFGVYSNPSCLSLLEIPLIWGPIGGIDEVPQGLKKLLTAKGRTIETVRTLYHKILFNFDPFVRLTFKRSKAILCRTEQTYNFFNRRKKNKIIKQILETGTPQVPALKKQNNEKLIIFFAGRLIQLKGVELALKAFKLFCEEFKDTIFEIAGEGYDKNKLIKLSKSLGIDNKVFFLGSLERNVVLQHANNCDIFLYPSLREGGTWALMEAMALEKSVICLDHSGPGTIVDNFSGIKIKTKNPEYTILKIYEALLKFARDPDMRNVTGRNARKRVENDFSWKSKGKCIRAVYNEVLKKQMF